MRKMAVDQFRLENQLMRQFFAEYFCMTFLLCMGTGAAVQMVTSKEKLGSILGVYFVWGFTIILAVGLSINISGGHLNPAISLAQWTIGNMSLKQMFVYWVAQFAGAFTGTGLTYANYIQALDSFDGGNRQVYGENGTFCCFISCAADYITPLGGIYDQLVGTGLLGIVAAGVGDQRHGIPIYLIPTIVGFCVITIGNSFAINAGFALNPARDFGARLFLWIPYGWDAISYKDYWLWVPIVGPFVGCVMGFWLYQFFIGLHDTPPKMRHRLTNAANGGIPTI